MKKAEGAIVDEAQQGSPAAKAGLQPGDVITAVNGTPVKDARDLARSIAMVAPDKTVKIDILRQGESRTLSVTLGTMPNQEQAGVNPSTANPSHSEPHLGLSLAPASEVPGAGGRGVVVVAVDPNGPAAERGFEAGNVILDVGGKAVANTGDVVQAIRDAKAAGRHDILMRVKAGSATHFVALPLDNA
jgi:serine protease Do